MDERKQQDRSNHLSTHPAGSNRESNLSTAVVKQPRAFALLDYPTVPDIHRPVSAAAEIGQE